MKTLLRFLFVLLAASPLGAFAISCGRSTGGPAPASSSSAPASAGTASRPARSADVDRSGDDEVRPVYPITSDPPDALAKRLCDTIHRVPAKRQAECCSSTPGITLDAECTRMLSYALRAKSVTLDPADIDRCAEAIAKATEGCDWVSPLAVRVPAACDGIIKGTLREGASCRASLECIDGLRCLGSGPTDAGRCDKPLRRGGPCGRAVDSLAAYTGQASSEVRHPECAGYCAQRWCADPVPPGSACEASDECGIGRYCIDKKCAPGPLPEAGSPCRGGLCATGARCAGGKCVLLGATGAPCARNADCRSGCNKPRGSATGKCAIKCWATVDDLKK